MWLIPYNYCTNFQVIKYWQRILKLKDNDILKHVYNSQLELYRLGHENWCTWVKDILTTTNLLHIWEEQDIDNNYLILIKERLLHEYMQQTLENIQYSEMYPKLLTYKLFKQEYKLENYLLQLKYLFILKYCNQFRISFHSLRIETG